jgi:transcriptional regulator with XRE-family HTH domain
MTTSRYDQIMRTFSKRLKKARQDAGFRSAQSFAGVLGLEPHSYRKYERGSAEPNFETLLRICELLNVEANFLLPRPSEGRSSSFGRDGSARAA